MSIDGYTHRSGSFAPSPSLGQTISNGINDALGWISDNASNAINNAVGWISDAASGAASNANEWYKRISGQDNVVPISGNFGMSAQPQRVNYNNAQIAQLYGMDRNTAYQEALSNTAYQRAVADLQAAGLNPVLAAGKLSGADSFGAASGVAGSGSGSAGGRSGSTNSSKSIWKLVGAGAGALMPGRKAQNISIGMRIGDAIGDIF